MLSLDMIKGLPQDMTIEQLSAMLEEQRMAKVQAKYERNRESHLACLKRYNEAHREELRQKQREYHEAHREEINARKRAARARAKISAAWIPRRSTSSGRKNIGEV